MILGQFAGGPAVRTDYNQTDPIKADYLVGRENIAPKTHVEDKNNPHGVTAEQAGARPNTWLPTIEEIGAAPAVATSGMYNALGGIVTSSGTTRASGIATVYISADGFVRVDYAVKTTAAGTNSSYADVGIDISLLRASNANIPAITPLNGGTCTYYGTNGAIVSNANGYGGMHRVSKNRWVWSRVHTTAGAVGSWTDNLFGADWVITGTCYGKVS